MKNSKLREKQKSPNATIARPIDTTLLEIQMQQFSKTQISQIEKVVAILRQFKTDMSAVKTLTDKIVLLTGNALGKKISVAKMMASKLDIPLYRIDMSVVVSKYIGETEKNLQSVFESLEGTEALLLFDEADALFRVEDDEEGFTSQDLEKLLQHLDNYPGFAIIAAKTKSNMLGEHKIADQHTLKYIRPKRALQKKTE